MKGAHIDESGRVPWSRRTDWRTSAGWVVMLRHDRIKLILVVA